MAPLFAQDETKSIIFFFLRRLLFASFSISICSFCDLVGYLWIAHVLVDMLSFVPPRPSVLCRQQPNNTLGATRTPTTDDR